MACTHPKKYRKKEISGGRWRYVVVCVICQKALMVSDWYEKKPPAVYG